MMKKKPIKISKKKFKSQAFASIHQTMEALYEIGVIDGMTIRECDEAALLTSPQTTLFRSTVSCG
jgi:DNA-binding transcriptional regulator YiaG